MTIINFPQPQNSTGILAQLDAQFVGIEATLWPPTSAQLAAEIEGIANAIPASPSARTAPQPILCGLIEAEIGRRSERLKFLVRPRQDLGAA